MSKFKIGDYVIAITASTHNKYGVSDGMLDAVKKKLVLEVLEIGYDGYVRTNISEGRLAAWHPEDLILAEKPKEPAFDPYTLPLYTPTTYLRQSYLRFPHGIVFNNIFIPNPQQGLSL
jgi:hypothetical protein